MCNLKLLVLASVFFVSLCIFSFPSVIPRNTASMPKKAGKKGGGKLVGMTEEEKLLYMQQKAQAEDETAKRKEDMLTHFLKVTNNI